MSSDSQAAIDRFVDAVWLEDGLSANTLAAYRRDLAALADWLSQTSGISFNSVQELHLQAYFAARHSLSKATSANRRLTVFKRYYRWALRERIVEFDPTLRMLAAKQALRCLKLCRKIRWMLCFLRLMSIRHLACATKPCWSCFTPVVCA